MTTSPVVTAIIIVYNGEAFLREAIASIAAQTFTEWELLIVDDGSSDASADIARDHALADGRIRLVEHADRRNHGMSATRNLGLSVARGEYVAFLDADDVWQPTKLAEQLAVFHDHPQAGMVYGRTLIWHSWDRTSQHNDFFYGLGLTPNRLHMPSVGFRTLVRNTHQTPTTCNAMMRRSAIEAVGGFEPSFTGMFEDQIFFAKMLLRFPVYVADRCWAKYRQHQGSCSARSEGTDAGDGEHLRHLLWCRGYVRRSHPLQVRDRLAVERELANRRARRLTRLLKDRLAREVVRGRRRWRQFP